VNIVLAAELAHKGVSIKQVEVVALVGECLV